MEAGTTITFMPDKEIFSTTDFEFDTIKKLIRERAYLVPNLFFHLYDAREGKEAEINFYFEGGITSLISKLNENKPALHKVIYIDKMEGDVDVSMALQYNDGYVENVESYVNVINTINGGTHMTGFRMALTRAIMITAKKSAVLKKTKRHYRRRHQGRFNGGHLY